ncbi:MAG: hypothetical protein KC656_08130, partial [Myxococcales bacterium]|nr:hypothetical protein [Myxococcales bacterium]
MTVLLALLLGCPKPVVSTLDPDLPEEAARPEARPPLEVLEAGADLEEPTLRALALEALVRTTSEPAGGAWGPRAL